MKQHLFQVGNHSITIIFYAFFSLTTYFAITSPNIILGDNHITGAGTTIVTTIFIILAVILMIGLTIFPHYLYWLTTLFTRYHKFTIGVLIALTVTWQLFFIWHVHPAIGFDVGAIHDALQNPNSTELRGYFSSNSNNLPLLLLQQQLGALFHQHSWLFYDLCTLILVDFSVFFNTLSIYLLDPSKVRFSFYLQIMGLIFFPMIIVPYTDTWVLPLVSLYFLWYCLARHSQQTPAIRYCFIFLFGITVSATYFIKPSAIVPAIAIGLGELLALFALKHWSRHRLTKLIFTLLLCIVSSGLTYHTIQTQLDHQTYIQIIPGREIPAVHFISMGVSGDGGYNAKDALAMSTLPTKKARSDYSIQKIKLRLHKLGFWGYLQFLLRKHRNNTADGTFAWVKEGNFISQSERPTDSGITGFLENFVYLYGKNLGDFRYLAQIIWIIILVIIFFGWRQKTKITQILRLSIIGAVLYLLIFEGGRSRYLIQFLPMFIILASLTGTTSFLQFKHLFSWLDIKF